MLKILWLIIVLLVSGCVTKYAPVVILPNPYIEWQEKKLREQQAEYQRQQAEYQRQQADVQKKEKIY